MIKRLASTNRPFLAQQQYILRVELFKAFQQLLGTVFSSWRFPQSSLYINQLVCLPKITFNIRIILIVALLVTEKEMLYGCSSLTCTNPQALARPWFYRLVFSLWPMRCSSHLVILEILIKGYLPDIYTHHFLILLIYFLVPAPFVLSLHGSFVIHHISKTPPNSATKNASSGSSSSSSSSYRTFNSSGRLSSVNKVRHKFPDDIVLETVRLTCLVVAINHLVCSFDWGSRYSFSSGTTSSVKPAAPSFSSYSSAYLVAAAYLGSSLPWPSAVFFDPVLKHQCFNQIMSWVTCANSNTRFQII